MPVNFRKFGKQYQIFKILNWNEIILSLLLTGCSGAARYEPSTATARLCEILFSNYCAFSSTYSVVFIFKKNLKEPFINNKNKPTSRRIVFNIPYWENAETITGLIRKNQRKTQLERIVFILLRRIFWHSGQGPLSFVTENLSEQFGHFIFGIKIIVFYSGT